MAVFQVYRDESAKAEYRWRFFADSGDLLANSGGDGYTQKAKCLAGIQVVKIDAGRYETLASRQGENHWHLMSNNRVDIVAASTNKHLTKEECEREINMFRAQAQSAAIVEVDG